MGSNLGPIQTENNLKDSLPHSYTFLPYSLFGAAAVLALLVFMFFEVWVKVTIEQGFGRRAQHRLHCSYICHCAAS